MVIELTPEQEALVLDTVRHEGKTVEQVVLETMLWLAETEKEDRAAIQRGLDQADRGEFVDEEEMDRRVAKMLQH